MSLLKGNYSPRSGGHAPGDVRDAFLEAVNEYANSEAGSPEPVVELREQQVTLSKLCGLLWNCSDAMPGSGWNQVCHVAGCEPHGPREDEGGPRRRTYGAVARWLKATIRQRAELRLQRIE